jgi:hypothetical protein
MIYGLLATASIRNTSLFWDETRQPDTQYHIITPFSALFIYNPKAVTIKMIIIIITATAIIIMYTRRTKT